MSNIVTPPFCELWHKQGGKVRLENFYRVLLGKREGQNVWIVDGAKVMRELYPAFVMGGNDQRYRFNPTGDIWLDNRIGAIELEYTLGHELIERRLMRTKGMTYDKAHQHGLDLELKMREADARNVLRQQAEVDKRIAPVYRAFYQTVDGVNVWLVDGPTVRGTLDGDFCFVASDAEYSFIPEGEIWLDATMTCEHVHFALVHEFERRRVVANGKRGHAYEAGLCKQIEAYAAMSKLATEHEAALPDVSYGNRYRGVKPQSRRRKRS